MCHFLLDPPCPWPGKIANYIGPVPTVLDQSSYASVPQLALVDRYVCLRDVLQCLAVGVQARAVPQDGEHGGEDVEACDNEDIEQAIAAVGLVDGVYRAGTGESDSEEEHKGERGGIEDTEEDCLDSASTGHGRCIDVVAVATDMLLLRRCNGGMQAIFPTVDGHDVSYAYAKTCTLGVVWYCMSEAM